MATQAEARDMARTMSHTPGVIPVATTIRPNRRGDGWVHGGWPDKESVWVVLDFHTNALLWPTIPG